MSTKNNRSEFIDFKGLIEQYLKNWYWFVISVVICVAAAYVFVKTHPRENMVKASILVSQDEGTVNMLSGLGGLLGADPYVQDEIFVITSHSILAQVSKELGINKMHYVKTGFLTKTLEYPEFPIDVKADSAIVDTLRASFEFKVKVLKGAKKADIKVLANQKTIAKLEEIDLPASIETDYGIFTVEKTADYPGDKELSSTIYFDGYDAAAENLADKLDTYITSKKSNVISLGISATNNNYGLDVLNTTMDVYNRRGIEDRNLRAINTAAFIAERIELIGADLSDVEAQIEHYKEGNRMIDLEVEAKVNTEIKTEYEAKLVELQTQKEILEMTLSFLKSESNKYDLLPVVSLDNKDSDKSLETYNELILKRLIMLSGAKPGNRNLADLEKQIDALRASITIAVERSIDANAIAIKEAQTQANMAIAKLGHVPTQEREFLTLKRQQEVKQALYLFLLERAEETSMMIANAVPKGTIIDKAYVLKDPIGLGKFVILIIALIIGVLLPVLCLYIKDLLRSKVNGRRDLEKHLSLPILGEICFDKTNQHLVVAEDSTTSSTELFRMLRANLQFVLTNKNEKVVMITSSTSGEGKSFISTNLSASLALLGKKVVLVGMDIRKPQLANYLGIPSSPGLTQYLSDYDFTIDKLLRPFESVPGLSVIVAGPIPPNPGELMTSPRIAELVDYLKQHFDYIILDTAPVGLVSDSFTLTNLADATIYVVRDKFTRLQDLNFIADLVEEGRLKRVNIVLNGTLTNKGYGYGYK